MTDGIEDSAVYLDPPTQIKNLLQATFTDQITSYFLGAPTYQYPDADFPVCVVQSVQSSNTVKNAPTGHDAVGELIHIHFFEQSKDDLNASDETQTTIRKLYNKIQGRDPVTGQYLKGTAMYALRTNLTLNSGSTGFQTVLDHDIQIDYDIIPQADSPTIVEAIITVVTRELVEVANRL